MKVVYLAGPLTVHAPWWQRAAFFVTHGRTMQAQRVREALAVATILRDVGYAVIVPHLWVYWEAFSPAHYEKWMAMDFAIIQKCDAVFRMDGRSGGVDREVKLALSIGVPVFTSVAALRRAMP